MAFLSKISLNILLFFVVLFLSGCQEKKLLIPEPDPSLSIIDHDYDVLVSNYLDDKRTCEKIKEDIVKIQPDFDKASKLYLESFCYYETEEKDEAEILKTLKEAYKLAPNDKKGVNFYALLIYRNDENTNEESIRLFEHALKMSPKKADLYSWMAENFGNLDEIEKQIEVLKSGIVVAKKAEDKEELSDLYSDLGEAYQDDSEPEEAIKYFKLSLSNTDDPYERTYQLMGLAYDELENYDEAINMYKKAIDIDSAYVCAYSNMGYALIQQKKYDEVKRVLKKALTVDKGNSCSGMAYYNLGVAYSYDNNCKEALVNYYLAVEHGAYGEENFGSTSTIAEGLNYEIDQCHIKLNEFDKGSTYLLKDESLNEDSYYYLGKVYAGKKDYEKAMEYLEKSIDVERTARAYELLASLFFKKRDFKQARQLYKSAIEEDPKISVSYARLGVLSVMDNNFEDAIDYYVQSLRNDPKNNEHRRQLFLVYIKNDDCNGAEKILSLLGEHADIGKLRATLGSCRNSG